MSSLSLKSSSEGGLAGGLSSSINTNGVVSIGLTGAEKFIELGYRIVISLPASSSAIIAAKLFTCSTLAHCIFVKRMKDVEMNKCFGFIVRLVVLNFGDFKPKYFFDIHRYDISIPRFFVN